MNLQVSEDWEATDWEATNPDYKRKSVPEFSTGIATSRERTANHKKYPSNTHRKKSDVRTHHSPKQQPKESDNIGYPTTPVGVPNTVSRRAKQKNQQQYRT